MNPRDLSAASAEKLPASQLISCEEHAADPDTILVGLFIGLGFGFPGVISASQEVAGPILGSKAQEEYLRASSRPNSKGISLDFGSLGL